MLKNLVSLEHKIGEKVVNLMCEADTSLEHVKSALIKFMSHVSNVEEAAKAQASTPAPSMPEPMLPVEDVIQNPEA
jgi:hypothetical protein